MKCPTCQKETTATGNRFRPFCSERCKLIDLGRWAGGEYRIPTREKPPEEIHPGEIHRPNGSTEDDD